LTTIKLGEIPSIADEYSLILLKQEVSKMSAARDTRGDRNTEKTPAPLCFVQIFVPNRHFFFPLVKRPHCGPERLLPSDPLVMAAAAAAVAAPPDAALHEEEDNPTTAEQ
jgi:hypothetical protein